MIGTVGMLLSKVQDQQLDREKDGRTVKKGTLGCMTNRAEAPVGPFLSELV